MMVGERAEIKTRSRRPFHQVEPLPLPVGRQSGGPLIQITRKLTY